MAIKKKNATGPIIKLLPYQQAFMADQSRVLVGIWCRQSGKDFTTACKAVDHALRTGQPWYIVSMTQRQADETFAKCKQIAETFKRVLAISGAVTSEDGEPYYEMDPEIGEQFRCQARTLHLPGGGRVVALPGRDPNTLAGLTGNLILTEFGLFPRGGYDHWRVLFPLITRGYQLILISTPRGKNTKYYEIVRDVEHYSVHRVDIQRAVADGLVLRDNNGRPTTIEAFRKLYGDEAGWAREYELQFSGDLESLVKWAQLEAASTLTTAPLILEIHAGAGYQAGFIAKWLKPELEKIPGARLECGWDVARHANLSSLWVNLRVPKRPARLAALVVMSETTFALQREIIREVMRAGPAVGYGDSTGLGMDSNETLATEFPGRWLGLNFTGASKRELGSILMTAYDDGGQQLPSMAVAKWIHTDVYAVQKEGDRETLKLSESANPLRPASHCDIAYSNALALKAAQIPLMRGHVWAA